MRALVHCSMFVIALQQVALAAPPDGGTTPVAPVAAPAPVAPAVLEPEPAAVKELPRPKLGAQPAWHPPVPVEKEAEGGAHVVVLARHELPLVHILVELAVGSVLDRASGKPGLCAATATMLLDGGTLSRDAPALAEAFEQLGDELKIETDFDRVRLSLSVQSKDAEQAVALLGDLLAHPRFDPAEWARTRARRIAEIQKAEDEPRRVAEVVWNRSVFGDGQPGGAPVLGTRESVETIGAADLQSFYEANVGPRAVTFIFAGDIDAARAQRIVGAALYQWKSSATGLAPAKSTATKTAPAAAPAAEPAQGPVRVVIVDRPGAPQTEVRAGHRGVSLASAEYPAASLLATILGGSFTSRLVQNLREKHGYTYGIGARFVTRLAEVPSAFIVRSAVRTDVTAPALREILTELQNIHEPIPTVEIDKARALIENGLVEGFADGREAAMLLGELVAEHQKLDFWSKLPGRLRALRPPALKKSSASLVLPTGLTLVLVGDRKQIEKPVQDLPFEKKIELRDAHGDVVK